MNEEDESSSTQVCLSWRNKSMKMQSTLRQTTGSLSLSSPVVDTLLKSYLKIYHNGHTGKLADSILYDTQRPWLSNIDKNMMNEIYYKAAYLVTSYRQKSFYFIADFYSQQMTMMKPDLCSCDNIDSEDYMYTFPRINCEHRIVHAKAHICAYILAWRNLLGNKSRDKYFRKMIKSVLSVQEEVFNFNPVWIINYESYRFENFIKMMYISNAVRQQSGTDQCLLPDLFEEMLYYFSTIEHKVNLEDIFRVKQQGLLDGKMDHKVSLSDSEFDRMRNYLDSAKDTFIKSLKDTIIESSSYLAVMFVLAATIVLIAKIAIGFAAKVIFKLLHFIYAFISGNDFYDRAIESEKVVQQSIVNDEELNVPFLPALILGKVINPPKDILKLIWDSPNTDKVMRRLGYLGDAKLERGIERIMDWSTKLIDRVKIWYCTRILGESDSEIMRRIQDPTPALTNWNDNVLELCEKYYKDEFAWTETNRSEVYKLYAEGLALGKSRLYISQWTYIWKSVSKLAMILEKFKSHSAVGTSIRNPPVTIYLTGDTGVGKSSVTYPLAVEALKDIFKKEEAVIKLKDCWKDMIYMRAAEQEYWDGYQNQFVTVFDDFSQLVDTTSAPNLELFEIIRAANCFPYPLHMASIEQKATTTFNSKIILVSSNLEKPDTQSLNFPTALQRRFDICVKVKRLPQYKGVYLKEFSPNIYEFTQYDMVSGSEIRNISYKELVELVVMSYFSRINFVDSINSYIEKVLEDEEIPVQQGFVEKFYEYKERTVTKCKSLLNVDTFAGLKDSALDIKSKQLIIKEKWDEFRIKHNYLVTAGITISIILAGLVFLKMFTKIRGMFNKKTTPFITPETFLASCDGKPITPESYVDPKIQVVKKESYSPKGAQVVKKESYSDKVVKVVKKESLEHREQMKKADEEIAQEQGILDRNAGEVLLKVARTNLYKMFVTQTNIPIGHVLFIRGRVALMPKHYVSALRAALRNDPDATVYFEAVLLKRSFQFRIDEMLKTLKAYQSPEERDTPVYSRDLMAACISTATYHMDALPHFVTRNDVCRVDITDVMLPVLLTNNLSNSDRAILLLRYSEGITKVKRVDQLPIHNEENRVSRIVRDAWSYNMDTQVSECGAPLIVRNNQIRPGKICGIHIAGIEGTGQGFSTPVYREDLEEILSQYPEAQKFEQRVRLIVQEVPANQQCQIPEDAEFIRMGVIERPLPQVGKTQICPSLAHATYKEAETKPCCLTKTEIDGKEFNPRTYRIGRLGNIPVALRQDMIKNSRDACLDDISTVIHQSKDLITSNIKAVYTFEEACLGIDGEEYVNAVKRDTSPGFPFVQMAGCNTRQQFFGSGMEYDLTSHQCKMLKTKVMNIIDSAKRGIVLDHYFMDTLKDERKPIHKAHKTRLFAAGPLDYLIACKMYFNGVVALLQKNRNWSHISVGTNPYSKDWSEIVQTLHRKSKNMIAGDFEGFDASQHQLLLEAAGEVLIQLSKRFLNATEEDERIMRVLLVSCYNSMHITGNEVYQWTHSLPSGHYLTAIINSIFVNVSFGCVWQLAMSDISYITARSFWENCGIVAYGDDHIVSVPSFYLHKFNQIILPSLFENIGLSYTMEDKDAVAEAPARTINEVSYLKRTFKYDSELHQWLAPLTLSTVLETPQWIHRCPDKRAQTIANLEFGLKELSLHSEEIWNKWAPALQYQCEKLGHYTMFKEQDVVRLICLGQDYMEI